MYRNIAMLNLYRRHRANCKSTVRRAKYTCPIGVQGVLRGESVRKSLDLVNWEAAICNRKFNATQLEACNSYACESVILPILFIVRPIPERIYKMLDL
jgi:hypothetical protein